MSKPKLSHFPLFLGDLLTATTRWKGPQRSLYILLLAYQWFDGPIPRAPNDIAEMCGYPLDEFLRLWQVVGRKFVECEGGLINLRCEEHREKVSKISNKRATAGKKGGDTTRQKLKQTGQQIGKQIEQQKGQQEGVANGQAVAGSVAGPSNPIQSNPILPIPTESACGAEGGEDEDAPPTFEIHPDAKPEGIYAVKLRQQGVRVGSMDIVLHQWIADGITIERLLEAVSIARITKKGEAIAANYLDKVVRDDKRMTAAKPAAEKITWRPPELDQGSN